MEISGCRGVRKAKGLDIRTPVYTINTIRPWSQQELG